MVVVIGGVGSQPALGAGLTAVPGFVKPFDSHGIGLEEFLDDVAVSIIEVTVEIGPCKSGEIAHAIDEKLRVGDAVFFFEFSGELFSRIAASVPGKSDVKDDFRIYVDGSVEPCFLFVFELDLFLINSDTVWLGCEVLVIIISVGVVPVLNRGSASFDAEPLAEVSTLC